MRIKFETVVIDGKRRTLVHTYNDTDFIKIDTLELEPVKFEQVTNQTEPVKFTKVK